MVTRYIQKKQQHGTATTTTKGSQRHLATLNKHSFTRSSSIPLYPKLPPLPPPKQYKFPLNPSLRSPTRG